MWMNHLYLWVLGLPKVAALHILFYQTVLPPRCFWPFFPLHCFLPVSLLTFTPSLYNSDMQPPLGVNLQGWGHRRWMFLTAGDTVWAHFSLLLCFLRDNSTLIILCFWIPGLKWTINHNFLKVLWDAGEMENLYEEPSVIIIVSRNS